MLSSPNALFCCNFLLMPPTSDDSMDGELMVEVVVRLSCESWSAEALLDLYSSL